MIAGDASRNKESKDEKMHRVERFYGSFIRSLGLPDDANADAIRCESKDGLLTVHVPKVQIEKQKAKQVKVE